jgi:hypothetical protein
LQEKAIEYLTQYVKHQVLAGEARALRERYPQAKFIITTNKTGL